MADSTPSTSTIASSSDDASVLRNKWLIGGAAALLLILGAFAIGYFQGRSPIGDLQERAEMAETRAATAESRSQLMEALALTYRTVLDLDARNFGTANERLQEGARVLGGVDTPRADTSTVDASRLSALQDDMMGMDINVALDLDTQRTRVLGFAERLNRLMPNPVTAPDFEAGGREESE